jgi:hypothetical protein
MNSVIRTTVVTASEFFQQVNDFYAACGRPTVLEPSSQLVLAYSNSDIVGVVRLCFENGTYLLRTMQVRQDIQQ